MYDSYYSGSDTESSVKFVIYVLIWLLMLASLWRIFQKAGKPGWASIVPVYNCYIMSEIAFGEGIYFLIMFVPIANLIYAIILIFKLASAFGKDVGFGFGMLFLGYIFFPILAFGNSQYIGVPGKNYNQYGNPNQCNPNGYIPNGSPNQYNPNGYIPNGSPNQYNPNGYIPNGNPNQYNPNGYAPNSNPNQYNNLDGYISNDNANPYNQNDYASNGNANPYNPGVVPSYDTASSEFNGFADNGSQSNAVNLNKDANNASVNLDKDFYNNNSNNDSF